MPKYIVTENNINIQNSSLISKTEFHNLLEEIECIYFDNPVIVNRTRYSLNCEWAVHKFLYTINFKQERTKDVDLNYPQKWYVTLAYNIIGPFVWLLIK